MDDDRKSWDWLLDGVAPFYGWLIAVVIVLSVLECVGVR